MSERPKGTVSPEYDNAKRLIMKEYERLKYERLKKENERLREALEKIANDEMLDIISATDIAVQALEQAMPEWFAEMIEEVVKGAPFKGAPLEYWKGSYGKVAREAMRQAYTKR